MMPHLRATSWKERSVHQFGMEGWSGPEDNYSQWSKVEYGEYDVCHCW